VEDLAQKAYRLPTPEEIINKVESLIGKDISSKLPDRVEGKLDTEVADIFFTLADKVEDKFDFKAILQNAASKDDPVQALYDAVVEKISDFEYGFEAIKSRALGAAKKFLSTSVGQKLNTLRLVNFYEGNGVFGFAKTVTVTPEVWLELGVEKIVNFALSKVDFGAEEKVESLIDQAVDYVLGYFSEATVTLGWDASVRVTGLYKAVFYDETGKNVILSTFLPVGTNLSLMLDEYVPATKGETFLGWKDIASGEILTKMPAKDVAFIADVDSEEILHNVIVVDPEDALKIVYSQEVADGTPLADLKADMLEAVEAYRGALTDKETLAWILDGKEYVIEDQTVVKDMTFTWKITTKDESDVYYNVTVVDKETQEPIGDSISVKEGDSLASHIEELTALLESYIGAIPEDKIVEWQNLDGTAYDLGAKILDNVTITWELKDKEPDEPDVYYTVTVYNCINGVLSTEGTEYPVLSGTSFGSAVSAWNADVISAYPALNEHEEFVYVYTHTWLDADQKALDMTAKITANVTVIANIALDFANAGIMVEGYDAGEHFKVYREGYYYILEWTDEGGWLDAGMDVRLSDSFIEAWVAHDAKNGFKMIATDSAHSIRIENAILSKLGDEAEEYAKVDFDAHKTTENWEFVADSGASYFTFDFIVDGDVIDLGAFDSGVEITMPFAAAANSNKVKTYLYVEGEEAALEIT
ncbi:MAG: hypothetical protein IJX13_05820, partial [Clostridia bacterium]|nr:hypothetical protein [Clostridia bacterium]